MKTWMVVLAVVGAIVLLLGGSYVSNFNYGNRAEKTIKAEFTNLENVRSAYGLKVAEVAQVPTMYKDDVKEVVTAALEGRYGAEGSKAVFQFLHEQNPSLDVSVYRAVQQVVEAGRNEFKTSQTAFVDNLRAYETNRGYLWKGFWLRVAGYPTAEFVAANYGIISDAATQEVFSKKVDSTIKLR